jgi:hypothetical protein
MHLEIKYIDSSLAVLAQNDPLENMFELLGHDTR